MEDQSVTPFPARLRELARERRLSVERVLVEAWDPEIRGTSPNAVKKVIAGARPLQPVQVEAISRVLKVDPSVFPEYRLAKTRELLDERALEGGLEEAWANYQEFVTGLMLLATQSATELERTMSSAQPSEANTGEVRNLLEARKRQNG